MPFVISDKNYKPEILEVYTSFHLSHQYDRAAKLWKFKGYICTKCGRTVQNPNIVPRHNQNCKGDKPYVYNQEPDVEQIFDVNGNQWKPFDTQIHK